MTMPTATVAPVFTDEVIAAFLIDYTMGNCGCGHPSGKHFSGVGTCQMCGCRAFH